MPQLKKYPPTQRDRIHARFLRATRRQQDFRVWIASGWGVVIGMTIMWLFNRWAS